jgi:hypothetical protein
LFGFGAGYAEWYDRDCWLYPEIYPDAIMTTRRGFWRPCTIGAHGFAGDPNVVFPKVLDACIQSID